MLNKDVQMRFSILIEELNRSNASVWVSTPSFADMCLTDRKFSQELMPEMKLFLFCGEILTNSTSLKLIERFPEADIINTYGPTESTVAVTEQRITKEIASKNEPLPIGKAKAGTEIEIWSENQRNLPANEVGEIVIIGDTVAKGYFNNETETEAAFKAVQRSGEQKKAYRTGDNGYLDNENVLHYIGRRDHQIKLNGYRIEVGDIEKNIMKIDTVSNVAVIPKYKDGKVRNLTAFVMLDDRTGDDKENISHIKSMLRESIPEYMVPKKWRILDVMPMNANGKINRKALEELL